MELITKLIVTDQELEAFTTAVRTRFGLDFTDYEFKSLKRGLIRLMRKQQFKSVFDLWEALLSNRSLMVTYIDELMVNLTEFYRNLDFWEKWKNEFHLEYISKNKIRFWHAGCSSGEEVFSMLTILNETKLLYKSEVLATDLSARMLEKAKSGEYHKIGMSNFEDRFNKLFPNTKTENYIKETIRTFKFHQKFIDKIQFQRHNLVQDNSPEEVDVIFCRNVMIYFDEGLKMKVLNLFYKTLIPGGRLVIGYYDMLPIAAKEMFELECPVTRVYRKVSQS
jgi:chemotaxis protein methyltransferase CheR